MKNRIKIELNENGEIIAKQCNKCGKIKKLHEYAKGNSSAGRASWCKECNKIYTKKYRDCNKEKISEQKKQHYKDNREEMLEQKKQYYKDNKEQLKKYKHEWYEKNKEKHSFKGEKWREKNKERKKYIDHEYYLKNKEKYKCNAMNYKKRKREVGGTITDFQIETMIEFFDNKSAYSKEKFKDQSNCELKDKISKDHIKAINNGGDNYIWNIVPCTQSENASKSDKQIDEWLTKKFGYTKEQIKEIKIKIYDWQCYAYCKFSTGIEPIDYIEV